MRVWQMKFYILSHQVTFSKGAGDCLWRVWLRWRGRNISAGLSHVSRKSSGCPSEHLSAGPLRGSLCLPLAAPRRAKQTAHLIQVDLGTGLQAPCPRSFPLRQWPEPSGRRQGAGRALLIHWAFPRLWEPERGQLPARRPGCVRPEFPALLPQGRVNGINSSQRPHISNSLDQLWLGQSSLCEANRKAEFIRQKWVQTPVPGTSSSVLLGKRLNPSRPRFPLSL